LVKEQRPAIPSEIKRDVRQRCGFGCVICGTPIYEYEHMLEWAEVKRHVADEITLLCDQHHSEKTKGLLPREKVAEANGNPYNKRSDVSPHYLLHYSGENVRVLLGDNAFNFVNLADGSFFAPLVIDGLSMVGFKFIQGKLFLNFIAFDSFNKPIVQIAENELVYDTRAWDIQWVGQALTIREANKTILLQLIFNPPDSIAISKGRILRNGIEFIIGDNYMFCTNNMNFFSGIYTENIPVGFAIGYPIPRHGIGMVMAGVPRYNIDRQKALGILKKVLSEHDQEEDMGNVIKED
jgi:hypothetical protein